MKIEIIQRDEDGQGTKNVTEVYADVDYIRNKLIELNNAHTFPPLKFIGVKNERTSDYVEITITSGLFIDYLIEELFKRITQNKVTHVTISNDRTVYTKNKELHLFIKCEKSALEVIKHFHDVGKYTAFYEDQILQ